MVEIPFRDRYKVLDDPWERRGPIELSGVLERQQYGPLLTALAVLMLTFLLFQLVISPIVIVVLLLVQGATLSTFMEALSGVMDENSGLLLTANAVGQVLGLALPTWYFARLHTSRPAAFLRWRRPDPVLWILGVLGLVALMPVVQWLGSVNELIPLPRALREFEQTQLDLIERVLIGDLGMGFTLLTLALVPAFCEEILFRGYAQRQTERAFGFTGGILFSGIVFGFYHLRLSQLLPLTLLGLYLAYLAWRTGSLWIPITAHFVNNGVAVIVGAVTRSGEGAHDLSEMAVPWYLVVAGAAVFGGVMWLLWKRVALLAGPSRVQDTLFTQPVPIEREPHE